MPSSLRRACHACTKSKRRCIPQLPSCNRCAEKQIPCVYDLEPVTQGRSEPQDEQDLGRSGTRVAQDFNDLEIIYTSVSSAKEASVNAIAEGHSTTSAATHPRIAGTAELIVWLSAFLSQVTRDGLAGKGTPFVHGHIVQMLSNFRPGDEMSTRIEYARRLTSIHELTIQGLKLLVLDKPTGKPNAHCEMLVVSMFNTTHEIWSSPLPEFDNSFQPWEAWLTAESIRRSMFAAVIIRGLFNVARNGYARYEPFFESCPFDPRAGLWEAETSEDWEERIHKHGGDRLMIKSYHEFIAGTESKLNSHEDGAFQRMLYVMYHGNAGIESLKHLDRSADRSRFS